VTEVIGQPIYKRIAAALRAQINSGELAIGDSLPSTRELMQIHEASNNVVRNAVEVLRQEGLVHGQPGKAVYVKARPQDVEAERVTIEDLREQIGALRDEVRELGAQTNPNAVLEDVAEIREIVNLLQLHLRTLYSRVAQPYPDDEEPPQQHRRKSG
jgi:DNA-binding GntR family transcriptional regulator